MKITKINVQNFLGARGVNIDLSTPINLFAGRNGAGKSSLQEAIRMALTGEMVRVSMKKDYGQLITEGNESGFAEVEIDGGVRAFVTLPDGKTTPLTEYVPPIALPYVLDAQRFAKLDVNERRAFLFGLMGLSAGGAEVKKRLLAKGCNDQKIEAIMPILRAGFETAHKEAQARARDEKTAWRTITGEIYGEKKAATWVAEQPSFDATALIDLQQRITAIDEDLAVANQRVGALQADQKHYVEAAQRLANLREKSNQHTRIADKLARDEAELKQWEQKVADLKEAEHSQHAVPCPDCGVLLVLKDSLLVHAASRAKDSNLNIVNLIANLPEYEKSLRLMQSAVANDKRDLIEVETAAKTIAELESAIVNTIPDEAEIHLAKKHLDDFKVERSDIATKLTGHQDAERQSKQAEDKTVRAFGHHMNVCEWAFIADALAPDGIPGEMLAETLEPINDRLRQSSEDAEWMRVHIKKDMSIFAAYPEISTRPYKLLSESEQWRADAMLAEAISYLSKTKLLVLDRFDVLDMKGREDLIAWLDILAQNSEVETALIFGTLKAPPTNLPATIKAHWLEKGVVI